MNLSLLNVLPILASSGGDWWWMFVILGIFVVIVVVIIIVKRKFKTFQSDEQPLSREQIAQEELDRILEPIEEQKPTDNEEE